MWNYFHEIYLKPRDFPPFPGHHVINKTITLISITISTTELYGIVEVETTITPIITSKFNTASITLPEEGS